MKIVCVAGASSGAGKTTVACGLLRQLPGWAALKVTRCHGAKPCPHKKRGCNVCGTLAGPYQLLEMTRETDVPGKDTWRLREAGAARVLWLIAQPEAVERGLRKALARLKSAPGVVVEGNAAVPWLKADLVVMVRRRAGEKETASGRAVESLVNQTFIFDPKRVERECKRWVRPMMRRIKEASGLPITSRRIADKLPIKRSVARVSRDR